MESIHDKLITSTVLIIPKARTSPLLVTSLAQVRKVINRGAFEVSFSA